MSEGEFWWKRNHGVVLYFARNRFSGGIVVFEPQEDNDCVSFFKEIKRNLVTKYGDGFTDSKDFNDIYDKEVVVSRIKKGSSEISTRWDFQDVNFFSQLTKVILFLGKDCGTGIVYHTANDLTKGKSAEAKEKVKDY